VTELAQPIGEILIATGNAGKVREFREMLGEKQFQWRSLGDFPNIGDIEETGQTFRENAILKAAGYAKRAGIWAMADDSGLEVDAIAKKPGVYSARWAELNGKGKGDAANNALLLEQLEKVPEDQRTGRFVCVLALADPTGKIVLTVRETIEGRIGQRPVGEGGFGYDPLFQVPALARTTAELSSAQKHEISHRGKALRRLKGLLEKTGLNQQSF
jgi:XTP/dITP diphosphohydrolase